MFQVWVQNANVANWTSTKREAVTSTSGQHVSAAAANDCWSQPLSTSVWQPRLSRVMRGVTQRKSLSAWNLTLISEDGGSAFLLWNSTRTKQKSNIPHLVSLTHVTSTFRYFLSFSCADWKCIKKYFTPLEPCFKHTARSVETPLLTFITRNHHRIIMSDALQRSTILKYKSELHARENHSWWSVTAYHQLINTSPSGV